MMSNNPFPQTTSVLPETGSSRLWQPIRPLEVRYDHSVPLRRSATTALIVSLIIGFIVVMVDVQLRNLYWLTVTEHVLYWSIGTFLLIWLWTWFAESKVARSTLYTLEERLAVDLNRDGVQGKPVTRYVLVRGNTQREMSDKEDRLIEFVRGCFETGKTGMDYWSTRGINRQQYEEWRDLLNRGGYIRNRGITKRSGWQFKNGLTEEEVIDGLFGGQL